MGDSLDGGTTGSLFTDGTASGTTGSAGSTGGLAGATGSGLSGTGGTSGAGPASGSAGTTGRPVGGSTGAQGAKTGPIKVGFLAGDFTALVNAVGGDSDSDVHAPARALVRGLNARGGIAGRKIEASYFTIDGSASDYSSQEQAACQAFTTDNRVEVLIAEGTSFPNVDACMLKAGIAVVAGAVTEGVDATEMRRFPNLFNPNGMGTDRQALALIEQGVKTGWLTSKNKLGVLSSGCPWGPRVYKDVIQPAAKRHGISVQGFDMGCYNGAAAISSYSSAVQSASLQFRGDGVDRVLFNVGTGDAANYVLFTTNADSQGWNPGYLVGSNAVAQGWVQQGVVSKGQAAMTRGSGWIPVIDDLKPKETPEAKACLDIARAGGYAESDVQAAKGPLWLGCDALLPLKRAVEATRGATALAALQPALEGLGSSYRSASTAGSATLLSATRRDGARDAAPFTYKADCNCFVYSAAPSSVGGP